MAGVTGSIPVVPTTRRPKIADPRGADLENMLTNLSPQRELIYRFALRGLSEHCRSDRAWDRRVEMLRLTLKLDEERLAQIFRGARDLEDFLIAELRSTSARPPAAPRSAG